jgi:hypothetical protein
MTGPISRYRQTHQSSVARMQHDRPHKVPTLDLKKNPKKKGCGHPVAPTPLVSLDPVFAGEHLLFRQHTLFLERLPQLTGVQ